MWGSRPNTRARSNKISTTNICSYSTGASRVFIFDHLARREPVNEQADGPNPPGATATRVHIDQSYLASRSRIPHHLPGEADRLLQTRHQIINVWRPIKRILKDSLAVADAHSVPESDLISVSLIWPNRKGETLTVLPNLQHQWYYLYGQKPEDVVLIKCYDSKLVGRARRAPHSAFSNPATEEEEDARESIENRALVFHEEQSAE